MLWQKTLTRVLALQNRAKHMESSLHFTEMFGKTLLPSHLLNKLNTAKEAKALYIKAQRLCILFATSVPSEDNVDAKQLAHDLNKSIHRISEIIKVIDFKASQFGIGDKPSMTQAPDDELNYRSVNKPKRVSNPDDEIHFRVDTGAAEDGISLDNLKHEVKHSLKSLADIIEYMERPTLLKIRKEIDKLVNY
jgi:hypothetical protein